jgi:hypothetical protein
MTMSIFAQTPVINGRLLRTLDIPNLTYSVTIEINLTSGTAIFDESRVKYKFNGNALNYVSGELLAFNSPDYAEEIVEGHLGFQKFIDIEIERESNGIAVTSDWIGYVKLNFNIINVALNANFCPLNTHFDGIDGNWSNGEWECDNEALPVELTSFTVEHTNNVVTLNWSTATEINNYGFEIERNRQKIDFVKGYGNSNSPKYYNYKDKNIHTGTYRYRLKQIDNDGTFEYSDEITININSPIDFELFQCYPNPFNSTTNINYSIPKDGIVKLEICNILGETINTLVNAYKVAGNYSVKFETNLPSGIYFYRIAYEGYILNRQMVLLK